MMHPTRRFAFSILSNTLLLTLLSPAACQAPFDPDRMDLTDAGTLDFTTYAGLQIFGEETDNAGNINRGALDLAKIQVALFTSCWDTLVAGGDDPNLAGDMCPDYFLYSEDVSSDKEACKRALCLQQAYLCLGYRNLELAESTGIYELSTGVFDYEAILDPDGVIQFKIRSPDGLKEGSVTSSDPNAPAPRLLLDSVRPLSLSYRIPPLVARNRTLPLIAAQTAFKEAGIVSAGAVDVPMCIASMVVESKNKSGLTTQLALYSYGFADAAKMLGEATSSLAANEINVGTAAMATNTTAQGQVLQWEGLVNSRRSAMLRIVGRDQGATLKEQVKCCTTSQDRPGVRDAVQFLRVAAIPEIFQSAVTDRTLMEKALNTTHSEPGQPVPTVDAFLGSRGITLAEVTMARQYLTDESNALGRIRTEEAGRLVGGIAAPRFQHPGAFYLGKAAGGSGLSVEKNASEYARHGVVQALDYFREKSDLVVAAAVNGALLGGGMVDLDRDHQEVFASVGVLGQQLAGSRRVVIGFGLNSDGARESTITVQGVVPGERLLIVRDEVGYRCLVEGSIDGAPCKLDEHVVASSNDRVAPEEHRFHRPLEPYITVKVDLLKLGPTDASSELFVATSGTSGRGTVVLLGSFPVPPPTEPLPPETTFPAQGQLVSQDIARSVEREPENCSHAVDVCGDMGIGRAFLPPLENELTEDSDPYENSWKRYLSLAESASAEADRLGEEMVRYGLEMDLRAEEAIAGLQDVCGVEIESLPDFPTGQPCDPLVEECAVLEDFINRNPQLSQCLSLDGMDDMERERFAVLAQRKCNSVVVAVSEAAG